MSSWVQSPATQKQNKTNHSADKESSLKCDFKSLPVSIKKLQTGTSVITGIALGTGIRNRDSSTFDVYKHTPHCYPKPQYGLPGKLDVLLRPLQQPPRGPCGASHVHTEDMGRTSTFLLLGQEHSFQGCAPLRAPCSHHGPGNGVYRSGAGS